MNVFICASREFWRFVFLIIKQSLHFCQNSKSKFCLNSRTFLSRAVCLSQRLTLRVPVQASVRCANKTLRFPHPTGEKRKIEHKKKRDTPSFLNQGLSLARAVNSHTNENFVLREPRVLAVCFPRYQAESTLLPKLKK